MHGLSVNSGGRGVTRAEMLDGSESGASLFVFLRGTRPLLSPRHFTPDVSVSFENVEL